MNLCNSSIRSYKIFISTIPDSTNEIKEKWQYQNKSAMYSVQNKVLSQSVNCELRVSGLSIPDNAI